MSSAWRQYVLCMPACRVLDVVHCTTSIDTLLAVYLSDDRYRWWHPDAITDWHHDRHIGRCAIVISPLRTAHVTPCTTWCYRAEYAMEYLDVRDVFISVNVKMTRCSHWVFPRTLMLASVYDSALTTTLSTYHHRWYVLVLVNVCRNTRCSKDVRCTSILIGVYPRMYIVHPWILLVYIYRTDRYTSTNGCYATALLLIVLWAVTTSTLTSTAWHVSILMLTSHVVHNAEGLTVLLLVIVL